MDNNREPSLLQDQNNLLGIIYMVAGIFFLSVMDAVAKWLVEDALDPIQLVAVRSWILVVVLLGYYLLTNQIEQIKPTRPVAQGVRGMFGFFATCFFFSSFNPNYALENWKGGGFC